MGSGISSTYRDPVYLPAIPDEDKLLEQYPPIALHKAAMVDGQLMFGSQEEFTESVSRGFFHLRVPDDVDLQQTDLFANRFYEDERGDSGDRYRGFHEMEVPGEFEGYFSREHDQWENFYIERQNWNLLPGGMSDIGEKMSGLGVSVLQNVLEFVGVPRQYWNRATGGLTDGGGHRMLAFNHFRPDRPLRGSKFHRDSGWVTVLRSTEPGLIALIDGELRSIVPEAGYFIVNFGSSLEVLTERLSLPVRANIHGVASTKRQDDETHRTSYVTFLDSSLDEMIYRCEDGSLYAVQSMAEFADQEVSRTYDSSQYL